MKKCVENKKEKKPTKRRGDNSSRKIVQTCTAKERRKVRQKRKAKKNSQRYSDKYDTAQSSTTPQRPQR